MPVIHFRRDWSDPRMGSDPERNSHLDMNVSIHQGSPTLHCAMRANDCNDAAHAARRTAVYFNAARCAQRAARYAARNAGRARSASRHAAPPSARAAHDPTCARSYLHPARISGSTTRPTFSWGEENLWFSSLLSAPRNFGQLPPQVASSARSSEVPEL